MQPPNPAREIFEHALDLETAQERAAYVREACGADAALLERVEALLQTDALAQSVLPDQPPGGGAVAAATEGPGTVIGKYKLLEPIGEGGMGVVYLAEQQEPVRRRVALKIIKLGMDTRQVVARFEAERQALALMDHPNIAKVLDGGATEESNGRTGETANRRASDSPLRPIADSPVRTPAGRPYFVMELVEGVPITEFCAQHQLSIEPRLRLFIPVCQAVQHAHQKGIIHRDLKPSNVMVSLQDGVPVPKVIDFGVAKATNQKLTEKTLFTNFGTMIGTPAYMSPEQAEMSPAGVGDVDTRSDIYSLGVLLYELLTGTTPFPEQRLRSVAYAEMQRIILQEEPERPSTRLRRTATAGVTSSLATRHPPLAPRPSSLAPDLDWIALKCLEKDRARRYENASTLAADLQRHLNHEPVAARPPSVGYRFAKFARRHAIPLASATVVLVALICAVAVSVSQALRARRAEAVARQEAAKSDALAEEARRQAEIAQRSKEFLFDNLLGVRADETAQDRNAEEYQASRLLLLKAARKLDGRFTNDPATEAELRMKLTRGFEALRDFPQLKTQALRALALHRSLYGPAHSNTFDSTTRLAWAQFNTGERAAALDLLRNALPFARPAPGELRPGAAGLVITYANLLGREGEPAAAIPYAEEAIARARIDWGPDHDWTLATVSHLADLHEWNGTPEAAEPLWRQLLASFDRALGPTNQLTLNYEFALGRNLIRQGQFSEGRPLLEEVVSLNHQQIGSNQWFTLDSGYWLGRAYEGTGQPGLARELYDRILPLIVARLPSDASTFCSRGIADFHVRQKDYERATATFRAIQQGLAPHPPSGPEMFERYLQVTAGAQGWGAAADFCRRYLDSAPDSAFAWLQKAWVFRWVGDETNYAAVVRKLLTRSQPFANPDQHVPLEIAALGSVTFSMPESNTVLRLIAALGTNVPPPNTNTLFWRSRALAQMHFRLGNYSAALRTLGTVEERVESDPYALFIQAACLHRADKSKDARAVFERATALSDKQLPQPLSATERFLTPGQLYQHLVMRRETEALLVTE